MKLPRLSIAMVMVAVAVVAINLAIARTLSIFNPVLPVSVALTGLALQAGGFILTRSRGRIRTFWIGFLTFGLMAMVSVIWAMVFAPNVGISLDPSTGKVVKLTVPGLLMWTWWSAYFESVFTHLAGHLHFKIEPLGIAAALIWSLPQFLIAVMGGLLCRLAAGRQGWRLDKDSDPLHDNLAQSPSMRVLPAKS